MATKGTLAKIELMRDSDGDPMPAIPLVGYANQVDLAASTGEVVPVPAGATLCYFSPSAKSANFKVQTGSGQTVVWSGDITDGTAPVTNPDMRIVSGLSSMSIESDTDQSIGLEFGNN